MTALSHVREWCWLEGQHVPWYELRLPDLLVGRDDLELESYIEEDDKKYKRITLGFDAETGKIFGPQRTKTNASVRWGIAKKATPSPQSKTLDKFTGKKQTGKDGDSMDQIPDCIYIHFEPVTHVVITEALSFMDMNTLYQNHINLLSMVSDDLNALIARNRVEKILKEVKRKVKVSTANKKHVDTKVVSKIIPSKNAKQMEFHKLVKRKQFVRNVGNLLGCSEAAWHYLPYNNAGEEYTRLDALLKKLKDSDHSLADSDFYKSKTYYEDAVRYTEQSLRTLPNHYPKDITNVNDLISEKVSASNVFMTPSDIFNHMRIVAKEAEAKSGCYWFSVGQQVHHVFYVMHFKRGGKCYWRRDPEFKKDHILDLHYEAALGSALSNFDNVKWYVPDYVKEAEGGLNKDPQWLGDKVCKKDAKRSVLGETLCSEEVDIDVQIKEKYKSLEAFKKFKQLQSMEYASMGDLIANSTEDLYVSIDFNEPQPVMHRYLSIEHGVQFDTTDQSKHELITSALPDTFPSALSAPSKWHSIILFRRKFYKNDTLGNECNLEGSVRIWPIALIHILNKKK